MKEKVALVVDDTPANRDFMERLLKMGLFDVRGASTGKAALEAVENLEQLTLAVVDVQLPDMNGLQLTATLRAKFPNALIVIATMYDDKSLVERAYQKGCNIFLVKPHGFMELFKRLTTLNMDEIRSGGYLLIDQFGPRAYLPASR